MTIFEERFWSKVRKTNGCWKWTGAISSTGYGNFKFQEKYEPAHRAVFLVSGITIPKDMVVDHICRRRNCINPKHLRFVTRKQNSLENNSSPFAKNKAKTQCKHGHPFDEKNTYIRPDDGHRDCRMCRHLISKKRAIFAKKQRHARGLKRKHT